MKLNKQYITTACDLEIISNIGSIFKGKVRFSFVDNQRKDANRNWKLSKLAEAYQKELKFDPLVQIFIVEFIS